MTVIYNSQWSWIRKLFKIHIHNLIYTIRHPIRWYRNRIYRRYAKASAKGASRQMDKIIMEQLLKNKP